MKKLSKTLTAIVMIIAMVVVMVIPASAVTGGYKWAYFPTISLGSNNNYVCFAQSYLYRFDQTIHSIWANTSSIIDGDFGPVTRNATIAFQTFVKNYYYNDMVIDGVIGSQTWGYMATLAIDYGTGSFNGNLHYLFKNGTTSYTIHPYYGIMGTRLPSGNNLSWYYNSNSGSGTTVPFFVVTN